MSKIMELADAWADALRDIHCDDSSHYRPALQAEVERMEAAHQQELAQMKADLKSCQVKNREQLEANMGLRDSMHRIEQGVDVLIEQRDKLNAEIAALRAALNELYVAAPTSLECQHFHHSKSEQHSYNAECKPAKAYLDALNKASGLLRSKQ